MPLIETEFTLILRTWEQEQGEAFSGSIALPIWLGENDHRQPYPGDHGVEFEQWKEAAAEAPEAAMAKA